HRNTAKRNARTMVPVSRRARVSTRRCRTSLNKGSPFFILGGKPTEECFMKKGEFRKVLRIGGQSYSFYDITELGEKVSKLPFSIRILLENALRKAPEAGLTPAVLQGLTEGGDAEIPFYPARVLMQDFTGVPAVVDLAAMRDAVAAVGQDPQKINPLVPVDLVVDHSVQVDFYGTAGALAKNVDKEY